MMQQNIHTEKGSKTAMQTFLHISQGHLHPAKGTAYELHCFRAAADYWWLFTSLFELPDGTHIHIFKPNYVDYLEIHYMFE